MAGQRTMNSGVKVFLRSAAQWARPLGCVVLVATVMCGHDTVGRRVVAADVTPTVNVTVYPLAKVTTSTGKVFGSCHDTPITVGGAPAGEIRVGIIETRLDGAGDMWRAAAWQAALTASQLLDFHPQARQATFSVQGIIDGPSAGALLTIGVASAVLGHDLRDDVTMTGTINPDGMIGPVGGIRYKIEGAAAAKKTTVLIPVHNRFEFDATTKKPIDLIAHGKTVGVTVIPVNDIWTAYEHMTGQTLPRPERGELPDMSADAVKHLMDRIPGWLKLYSSGRTKYQAFPQYARSDYSNALLGEADDFAKRVDRLLTEGQFASAYWDAVWATTTCWAAHEIGRYQHTYQSRGARAAFGLIHDDEWLTNRIETTAAAMRFYRPQTYDQLAIYLEACDAFFEGLAYYQLADVLRTRLPQDQETAATWVAAIAEQHALSWIAMRLARDFLELADRYEGTPLPDAMSVHDLTQFCMRSADAGMAMVNALEVNQLAKQYNSTSEQAQAELSLRDPVYAIGNLTKERILPLLPKYFGEGDQLRYANLAAARSLYSRSAMLVAKYYSLGVELDENYEIVAIGRERTLNDWLGDSEDQAIRSISALQNQGIDTTTCRQLLSVARLYRGRDMEDRVEALEYYFGSTMTAQLLSHLRTRTSSE